MTVEGSKFSVESSRHNPGSRVEYNVKLELLSV